MGNTCKPMAVSFQCMTKSTTNKNLKKIFKKKKMIDFGKFLAVQWLRLHSSNAGGVGSIPGRGTETPHGQKISKIKRIDFCSCHSIF